VAGAVAEAAGAAGGATDGAAVGTGAALFGFTGESSLGW
jgi:hypothetical protein